MMSVSVIEACNDSHGYVVLQTAEQPIVGSLVRVFAHGRAQIRQAAELRLELEHRHA